MKLKTLAIVVAVLAVATAAAWFFGHRGEPVTVDPRTGTEVLDQALVARIAAVHLRSDGKDVTLVNTDPAGSSWVVREYYDLPVDFTKLSRLVSDLREARVLRFASVSPERVGRMEFDGSAIDLRDADGGTLWSLKLGKSSSGGRFVKFGDEDKAYLASLTTWLDTTAKNWADAVLVPAKTDEVVGIEVDLPEGGTLKFTRADKDSPWTSDQLAEGEKPKTTALNSLASRVAGLRFTESTETDAPDAVAAREHLRTVKVTVADGKTYAVNMGRRPAPPAPPAPPPAETTDTTETGEAAAPAAETPPAPQPGPVYAFVTSSADGDSVNAIMQRRAFQISEWTFNDLPADRDALVEKAPPAPAPPPETPAAPAPEPGPAP